jgi:hypothetical protein
VSRVSRKRKDQQKEINEPLIGREAFLVRRLSHRVLSGLLQLDDLQSVLDLFIVFRDTTESGDGSSALLVFALLGIEGRRFGREGETSEEDETPDELKSLSRENMRRVSSSGKRKTRAEGSGRTIGTLQAAVPE